MILQPLYFRWTAQDTSRNIACFDVTRLKQFYRTAMNACHSFVCFFDRLSSLFHISMMKKHFFFYNCGPGSSVGIATDYGLDGPGIESRMELDIPPVQTGPNAHTAYCRMGTGTFQGVKSGRGVLQTSNHLLVPRSWKSRAIPLPTLWATPGL